MAHTRSIVVTPPVSSFKNSRSNSEKKLPDVVTKKIIELASSEKLKVVEILEDETSTTYILRKEGTIFDLKGTHPFVSSAESKYLSAIRDIVREDWKLGSTPISGDFSKDPVGYIKVSVTQKVDDSDSRFPN